MLSGFKNKHEEEKEIVPKTETVNLERSAEVVVEFNGNIREVLSHANGTECNTLLATDAMIKETLCPLDFNDADFQKKFAEWSNLTIMGKKVHEKLVGESNDDYQKRFYKERKALYELIKFNPVGSTDASNNKRKKATCLSEDAVVASAVKAYDIGLLSLDDLKTYRACFINFAVRPNITGVGADSKIGAIFNGLWYTVIAGQIWLIQYKSNYAGGQQYMADLRAFTRACETTVPGMMFQHVLGQAEVYKDGKQCYEILRLQTENPLKYSTVTVDFNGNLGYPSVDELEASQFIVNKICADGKGTRNLVAKAQFVMNKGYASENEDWIIRELTEDEQKDLMTRLTTNGRVNEAVQSAVIQTVEKFVEVD